MEETLIRVWEDLIGRVSGPLTLRLVIQPAGATILAIRAGLNDSRHGKDALFLEHPSQSRTTKRPVARGGKDVGKLFITAVDLDVV